jgi:protein-S-isoprenylcysteine O-methyltransferase Ste14
MELSPGIAAVAPAEASVADTEHTRADVPPIVAPAPWIAFGAMALGVALDSLHSFGALAQLPSPIRHPAALALIAGGCWSMFCGLTIFRRAGTAFQPWIPTRVVTSGGIYSRTRNPMYQGLLLLLLGLAMLLRSDWTALLLMPAAMLIHYGVVLREEAYLERRFGEGYRAYQAAVRRYGWPF